MVFVVPCSSTTRNQVLTFGTKTSVQPHGGVEFPLDSLTCLVLIPESVVCDLAYAYLDGLKEMHHIGHVQGGVLCGASRFLYTEIGPS